MEHFSKIVMSTFSIDTIQLDPGFGTRTARIQLLYGAWVNLAQLAIGLAMGFASVLIPQLCATNSPIPITREDASWIASVLPLFCPIGCIISGVVMDRHGRKIMLIFSQIPMFAGWLYSSFAKTPYDLIIGRAITGVGCGMAMGPPRVYCTEISLPNLRGVIGSFSNMAVSIGITVQAGLGVFLGWKDLCYTCCGVTLFNFFSFTLLPETPYYVLLHKSEQQARDNLAKFRGPNYNLEKEMEQLRDFKADNDLRKYTCYEKMGLLFSKASCKPFMLIITYVFFSQAAGNTFILYWTIQLLTVAKSSLDPEIGNIVLGITRTVMSGVTGALLYKIGRRPLAIMSAIGVTIVCLALGLFFLANDSPSLMPPISLTLYMVFATLGYYILPILMAFELYPLQVRGILGGATISIYCFTMFASTKMEPLAMEVLGLSYTFIVFGCFSLLCILFLFLYLPETKDLTLQEIEEYYKEIRPTLISQRRIMSMSQMGILSRANMSKSRTAFSKSRMNLSEVKPSILAKLEMQKKLQKDDSRNIYDDYDDASNKSEKSVESKKLRVIFDETADDERLSRKYTRTRKRENKDNKDEDQPSTSK
ncbi:hypothetical protein PYW08_014526 [Mythimna loreyi]|uniref:Uncharacterized protein n=1 Tax=Mythimna loreyi TaxID=667449 RepID=A0ACC2R2Q3_9NEOP|nr:hypothetical protein PYW08_014526 [Mythimna loreyi]